MQKKREYIILIKCREKYTTQYWRYIEYLRNQYKDYNFLCLESNCDNNYDYIFKIDNKHYFFDTLYKIVSFTPSEKMYFIKNFRLRFKDERSISIKIITLKNASAEIMAKIYKQKFGGN